MKQVLNITFQGELDEEGLLPFLWLVRFPALVSPAPTAVTGGLVLLECQLTSLAEFVNACPAIIGAEEAKKFLDSRWEKVEGKKEADEAEEGAKGFL